MDSNAIIKKILFLAANPKNSSNLRLHEELREIDEGLRRSKNRRGFDLFQRWAVRTRDVYRSILDVQPWIIHFSGHGVGDGGIVLEDETGNMSFVTADTLFSMFRVFSQDGVECVLLNACYSEIQVNAISEHIPYVIGMREAIGDKAAISFAVAFYDALGAGRDIDFAFDLACSQLIELGEHETPILKKKVVLASSKLTNNDFFTKVHNNTCLKIQQLCGKIRLLNCQEIEVDRLYVDVYLLERLGSECYAKISDLLGNLDFRDSTCEFNRLGLGKRNSRLSGQEVALAHPRLMLLGKPGSGKSTFLRYLAICCCKKEYFSEYIPVLIELRFLRYSNQLDLFATIQSELNLTEQSQLEYLLREGKLLLLLDGLDEIVGQAQYNLRDQINKFSRQYYKNRFIITCRTQTSEYILDNFTYVEIADFNQSQIEQFIDNLFFYLVQDSYLRESLRTRFNRGLKLPINNRIAQLAVTPILLNMTCLVFIDLGDFPSKISDLYEQSLRLLLEKWNERGGRKKEINIEEYRNLSIFGQLSFLSRLATYKFQKQQYILFEEYEICSYIREYFNISNEQSKKVLNTIEEQYGLLIERAKGIYSFSHLTLQEYLVAKYFSDNSSIALIDKLSNYFLNNRWREVILMVSETIKHNVDYFIVSLKNCIDAILVDEKLNKFLEWISRKSSFFLVDSVGSLKKTAAIRSAYFSLAFSLNMECQLDRFICKYFDSEMGDLIGIVQHIFLNDDRLHYYQAYDPVTVPSIRYALNLDLFFRRESLIRNSLSNQFGRNFLAQTIYPNCTNIYELAASLPKSSVHTKDFQDWWANNGKLWLKSFREVLIKDFDIGHDWQFNEQQKELLWSYYRGTKLLIECLKKNHNINLSTHQYIEQTIFTRAS